MSSDALQFGRYQLLERIAAGGMGEVYVALQTGIGEFRRPVAVKLLLPHLADDQHIISMFLREARVAAQMQSAHIAQVYDVGFEHERYFIAMELVRGVSLSKLIAGLKGAGRQLGFEQLVHVARGLCDGLHVAHEQRDPEGRPLGVVHRDVTPHNILVSVDGVVKLTDFGIARVAEGDKQSKPGVVLGKLGYLAPEQMRGQPLDRRVDVFAAGATLFHLAALEKPFDTPTGQLLDASRLPRAPLRVFRPDLPRPFIEAIEKAMAVEVKDRFATAREFRLALPEVPSQEDSLGALVREVCGAALVDLDRKTERATRPHGTAAIARKTVELATPAAREEPSQSVSLGAARPSRLPVVLGGLALVLAVVAVVLPLRRGAEV
ncbi:MAG: serine/threonine-protein kinase, partial [Myxococcota bacterium]